MTGSPPWTAPGISSRDKNSSGKWNGPVLIVISLAFFLKLGPAFFLEFGNDEVYYWTYSTHLQWNYFDHPPMVAFLIRLFTGNLLWQAEGFIRLGSLVCSAFSTWLIYKVTSNFDSGRAGFLAAVLFSASFYGFLIAGFMIMPDSAQVLFWCASLYFFQRLVLDPGRWDNWFLAGICTGLCVLSKVHALFLPGGLFLFALIYRQSCLRSWAFWSYLLIAALFTVPIFWWNYQNDFVTFRFHGERVSVSHFELNSLGFLRELLGEILYNNPINVVLAVMAVAASVSSTNRGEPFSSLLKCVALPMICMLLMLSLFRDTLPHWSGPAYITLIPLTAVYLNARFVARRALRIVLMPAVFAAAAFLGVVTVIELYPGTLGKQDTPNLGLGDVTLDLYGWRNAGSQFARLRNSRQKLDSGLNPALIVASKWFPAAHEDFYFCRPGKLQLVGLGSLNDLHQYWWLNSHLKPRIDMASAYCIVPSNLASQVHLDDYYVYYSKIDSITRFSVFRNGRPSRYFTVYLLQGWHGRVPVWPPLYLP